MPRIRQTRLHHQDLTQFCIKTRQLCHVDSLCFVSSKMSADYCFIDTVGIVVILGCLYIYLYALDCFFYILVIYSVCRHRNRCCDHVWCKHLNVCVCVLSLASSHFKLSALHNIQERKSFTICCRISKMLEPFVSIKFNLLDSFEWLFINMPKRWIRTNDNNKGNEIN